MCDVASELVKYGCAPDELILNGYSIVHAGAFGGIDALKLSIQMYKNSPSGMNMTDREIANFHGDSTDVWTPLFLSRTAAVAEFLLELGADIEYSCERDKRTVLHRESSNDSPVTRTLLENGANMNPIDFKGRTPLHFAVSNTRFENVKLLVEHGADINIRDNIGRSPLDIADSLGYNDFVYFLWKNGAERKISMGEDQTVLEWTRPIFRNTPVHKREFVCLAVLHDIIYHIGMDDKSPEIYTLDLSKGKLETIVEERDDEGQKNFKKQFVLDTERSNRFANFSQDKLEAYVSPNCKEESVGIFSSQLLDPDFVSFGYAEMKILDMKPNTIVTIGLVNKKYVNDEQPGWREDSYGYHGDDGKIFICKNTVKIFGPTFKKGDVVGAGVNFDTSEIFFTKNGELVGVAEYSVKRIPLKFMSGIQAGSHVSFNFGNKPFLYNFKGVVYNWKCDEPYLYTPNLSIHVRPRKAFVSPRENIYVLLDRLYYLATNEKIWIPVSETIESENIIAEIIGNQIFVLNINNGQVKIFDLDQEDTTQTNVQVDNFPSTADTSALVGKNILFWNYGGEEIFIYDTESNSCTHHRAENVPPLVKYSVTPIGNKIYTFGGHDGSFQVNDLYCLDTETLKWSKPRAQGLAYPHCRNSHSTCIRGEEIFHISGFDGQNVVREIEVLKFVDLKKEDSFGYFFENPLFSDVDIICEGRTIKAHKPIISSMSEFFRNKLQSNPGVTHLEITEIPFQFLNAMLRYFYTEDLTLGFGEETLRRFMDCVEKIFPEYKDIFIELLLLTRIEKRKTLKSLSFAWETSIGSDLTLITQGTEFSVHKVVLSSRNSFFNSLLNSGMKESNMETIPIDCDTFILYILLKYIYTREFVVDETVEERFVDIFLESHKFDVEGLFRKMEDILCNNIDLENVISLLFLSDQIKSQDLQKRCIQFIRKEAHQELLSKTLYYAECESEIKRILGTQ
eukprot:TRINITY_DN2969_c0_g1_i1.p1 TRINITY_DN2969_c0_g1~~TRINITY_DN2969_c0_g1_i1.p1  ORF type:complete len:962 (-),score=179.09 TRINITY_DN2969_c0_g1_i1:201-3086(-)